jgi:acid phosphatase (class A)
MVIPCRDNARLKMKLFPAISLLVALAAQPLLADKTELHYLAPETPDAVALLAPPPLAGSPEQAADLAEVRTVSANASPAEKAAAMKEKSITIFNFSPVIGTVFAPGKLPKAESFLDRVKEDAENEVGTAKNYWKRPRPYSVDPTLANGKLEKSFSYPSGHSTESMVIALVLADLFPEKRDGILAEARLIGWHRVEIARHYATDIYAGRVFAQAIVREMKKSAEFQKDFAAAKAEIEAAQATARN